MDTEIWYQTLIKPNWAPPSFLFGLAWSILYPIIIASFCYVGILFFQKKISFGVFLPFILNLIFNLLFTTFPFGLKNTLLSAIDISLVLVTLVWALIAIWKSVRWVAYVNIPYLLWGAFATALQFSITYLNWK